MFKCLFTLFLLPLVLMTSCGNSKSESVVSENVVSENQDKDAFQKEINTFVTAWNNHDSKAMSDFWAVDGDFLSPLDSAVYTGRDEIEKHFAKEHNDIMKESRIEVTVDKVKKIDQDTAFVDVDLTIKDRNIAGEKAVPYRNHGVFLFVKRDGQWQVLVARPY